MEDIPSTPRWLQSITDLTKLLVAFPLEISRKNECSILGPWSLCKRMLIHCNDRKEVFELVAFSISMFPKILDGCLVDEYFCIGPRGSKRQPVNVFMLKIIISATLRLEIFLMNQVLLWKADNSVGRGRTCGEPVNPRWQLWISCMAQTQSVAIP